MVTRHERVKSLLRMHGALKMWTPTMAIKDVSVGGAEGCARARELRFEKNGALTLEKRRMKGSTQFEYRVLEFWGP